MWLVKPSLYLDQFYQGNLDPSHSSFYKRKDGLNHNLNDQNGLNLGLNLDLSHSSFYKKEKMD